MTAPAPDGSMESWDKRLETFGRIGPYVLLLISTLLAVIAGPWENIWITLGLPVFAAAWIAWWAALHPGWAQRGVLMGIYYVGLIALSALLAARTPWFAFFAFTGVMVALQLFRGFWRYAGIFVPTVLIAICQTGGFHPLSVGLVVLVLVLAVFESVLYVGFGLMGEKGDEQNRKRKQMIDELAEANRRLEETLLIVDDHPVVRDGLRGMFAGSDEFDVVGDASDGVSAVARAAALHPDVVLMDLRMPGGDGVSAISRMSEQKLGVRVLVLTTYDTDSDVLAAIEAGATGYLLKDARPTSCCGPSARPRAGTQCSRRRWPPGWSGGCVLRCPRASRSASASSRCSAWWRGERETERRPRGCSSARPR